MLTPKLSQLAYHWSHTVAYVNSPHVYNGMQIVNKFTDNYDGIQLLGMKETAICWGTNRDFNAMIDAMKLEATTHQRLSRLSLGWITDNV